MIKRSWISYSLLALLCAASVCLTGCNEKGNPVAVVDLDAVAKALGKDQAITKQLQQNNAQITDQLNKIGQNFQQQLKDAADKAGPEPSDDQQKQLAAMRNDAQQKFAAIRQAGVNRLREAQLKLAEDFRNEVKPVAERFARQRGASVVLVSTGMILWMDNQVDITADVIGAMRSAPTSSAAPASAPAPSGDQPPAPPAPNQ